MPWLGWPGEAASRHRLGRTRLRVRDQAPWLAALVEGADLGEESERGVVDAEEVLADVAVEFAGVVLGARWFR